MGDDTRTTDSDAVEWVTEAMTSCFLERGPGREGPPAGGKVAWEQPIPVLDVKSSRNAHDVRTWTQQLKLLRRREAVVAAEIAQAPDVFKGMRDVVSSAREAPSSDAASLTSLHRKLWADVDAVKAAVSLVVCQLSRPNAAAGQDAVLGLASKIDRADRALGQLKRQQATAWRALVEQEERLEADLEACILDIVEGPVLIQPTTAAPEACARGGGGPGPGSSDDDSEDSGGEAGSSGGGGGWGSGGSGARGARGGARRASVSDARRGSAGGGGGCLAPEVATFEDFVCARGEYGGWEKEDHEEFVRIVKACGGDYARAVAAVMEDVIGYSKAEVVAHANWHMDYMDLLVRKRGAIGRWRAQRDEQRAQQASQAALLMGAAEEHAVSAHARAARDSAAAREAAVQKELVAQWKAGRADAQAAEEARRADAARAAAERAAAAAAARQAENRAVLADARDAKARAEAVQRARVAAAAARDAAAAGQRADPAAAWRVRERNECLLKRRHDLQANKEAAARARSEAQARILEREAHVPEACADPGRVLKGTRAHMITPNSLNSYSSSSSSHPSSMAPAIKLYYFDLPGRAEVIRIMLHHAAIEFEDVTFAFKDWPEWKAKMPFGAAPALEVDGKRLAQSSAIERYVAKLAGLYPTDDAWAAAKVDEAVGVCCDVTDAIMGSTGPNMEAEEKAKLRAALVAGPLKPKFANIVKVLAASGGPYMTGDKLTYADIVLFKMLSGLATGTYDGIPAKFCDEYPELKAFHARIAALPVCVKMYGGLAEGPRLAYKQLP
ncbi:hypothetical protein FOA52_006991 [Chlamydomonas sp. UWO 241]|nr:hypothetical protein FOA52_006991 [Chlamydomonas sp. UWO 241]